MESNTDWSYEKEWQLAGGGDNGKEEEFIRFEPEEVTAIYLGCRMTEADAKAIKALAAEKYAHATLYTGSKSKFE